MFLFETADAAVHFGLKLIPYWKQRRRSLVGVQNASEMSIRVGCHFGECWRMGEDDAWIGRAINLAKRVETTAEPDCLFVTQAILELIDLPIYDFNEVGAHDLKGDFLPRRQLYRLISVDHDALVERPIEEMSAEDWFLKGVEMTDRRINVEEELSCYQQAIQLRDNYPEAHNNLAILLKTAGDLVTADQHYKEALKLWPVYPEAHYNYAILLETTNDRAGAATHYQEAIRHRPGYTDARLRYAGLLAAGGASTEAERQYEEVLRLEAHNNYGNFLEKRGKPVEAEHHYMEALRQRPNYAEAHYNYAMLLENSDRTKAKAHYRAAIEASPNYAEAHNNLAVLLHEDDDLAGAEEHYSAALRLRPNDPETNYNYALLAQAKGDTEAASHHFQLSNELAPKTD
jgi:tetratricopeptide (TPR) repeat protein